MLSRSRSQTPIRSIYKVSLFSSTITRDVTSPFHGYFLSKPPLTLETTPMSSEAVALANDIRLALHHFRKILNAKDFYTRLEFAAALLAIAYRNLPGSRASLPLYSLRDWLVNTNKHYGDQLSIYQHQVVAVWAMIIKLAAGDANPEVPAANTDASRYAAEAARHFQGILVRWLQEGDCSENAICHSFTMIEKLLPTGRVPSTYYGDIVRKYCAPQGWRSQWNGVPIEPCSTKAEFKQWLSVAFIPAEVSRSSSNSSLASLVPKVGMVSKKSPDYAFYKKLRKDYLGPLDYSWTTAVDYGQPSTGLMDWLRRRPLR